PFGAALWAWRGDLLAGATAGGAGPGSHHLAEERALHRGDLARAVTRRAGARRRTGCAPGAGAGGAHDRRLDVDLLADAEGGLGERERELQQRIRAGTHPAAPPPRTRRGATAE